MLFLKFLGKGTFENFNPQGVYYKKYGSCTELYCNLSFIDDWTLQSLFNFLWSNGTCISFMHFERKSFRKHRIES